MNEFIEEQKFTQWWLRLLLISIAILPIVGIYKQLILGEEFGNKPISNQGIIVFSIFVFVIIALFLVIKLQTSINRNGIQIKFYPFVTRNMKWKDIEKLSVVNYGFVGGWGIRISKKYGTVYNVKGNIGLSLKLKNGKKILIGTQHEKLIEKVVKNNGIPITNKL